MLLNCGMEKTLESPLGCKEIQPVHPKGDQSWIFIGRTDAEAETPILWPPDSKSWLVGKGPDAEKDWRQEEKGTTEDDEMVAATQRTWVWVNSESWWWTGRPDVLQSMRSQRVGHDWVAEKQQPRASENHYCKNCTCKLFSPLNTKRLNANRPLRLLTWGFLHLLFDCKHLFSKNK